MRRGAAVDITFSTVARAPERSIACRSASLAHRQRPPRTRTLAAKAGTHRAKSERPGREARAFTLNRSARQFRARLLK